MSGMGFWRGYYVGILPLSLTSNSIPWVGEGKKDTTSKTKKPMTGTRRFDNGNIVFVLFLFLCFFVSLSFVFFLRMMMITSSLLGKNISVLSVVVWVWGLGSGYLSMYDNYYFFGLGPFSFFLRSGLWTCLGDFELQILRL